MEEVAAGEERTRDSRRRRWCMCSSLDRSAGRGRMMLRWVSVLGVRQRAVVVGVL